MRIKEEFGEWKDIVDEVVTPAWVNKLVSLIKAGNTTPPSSVMFRALRMPPGKVRVVLLGQD